MKPTVKLASLFMAVLMLFSVIASGCSLSKEWSYKTDKEELGIGVYITAIYFAYQEAQAYASELEDYDASSNKWLDLEITDADGNTEVASKWIKKTAERRCLMILALEPELKRLGATMDEATGTIYSTDDEAAIKDAVETYWYLSYKKILEPKGVSLQSFKLYFSNYFFNYSTYMQYMQYVSGQTLNPRQFTSFAYQDKLFETLYLKGGTKEVSKDEITKYFEENYVRYSYLPMSLYEATTDEAGNESNAKSEADQKKITDAFDSYAKQINEAADTTAAGESFDKLASDFSTENGLTESDKVTGTAPKDNISVKDKDLKKAIEGLEEGKAVSLKLGEGKDAKAYLVFRYNTKAAKEAYLDPGTNDETIVKNMKKTEFEDYITDLIDEMGYKKSDYVGKYEPKMFWEKPKSTTTVTA